MHSTKEKDRKFSSLNCFTRERLGKWHYQKMMTKWCVCVCCTKLHTSKHSSTTFACANLNLITPIKQIKCACACLKVKVEVKRHTAQCRWHKGQRLLLLLSTISFLVVTFLFVYFLNNFFKNFKMKRFSENGGKRWRWLISTFCQCWIRRCQ